MTEVAVFSFGAVMFVLTTWATLAFGLRRIHELQLRDLEESDVITEIRDDGLTEIHVTLPHDVPVASGDRS